MHMSVCVRACVRVCMHACMRVCIFLHMVGHSRQCHGCVKYSSCAIMQGHETPAFSTAFPSFKHEHVQMFCICSNARGSFRGAPFVSDVTILSYFTIVSYVTNCKLCHKTNGRSRCDHKTCVTAICCSLRFRRRLPLARYLVCLR
jgi:hypothetical protein